MDKKELRAVYAAKRSELSADKIEMDSALIKDLLFSNVDFSKIETLHCFLPARGKNEINTWLILNNIFSEFSHIEVVTPVCDFENGALHTARLNRNTNLIDNKWGIPEPAVPEYISPEVIDLVLLPLLIMDKFGNRVGYGKGFYDKFLVNCRENVLKVGLSLFEPVNQISNIDLTDIPLDVAVTPSNVIFY